MSSRIEDYALIGDCETAALVSRDGSIDWLCWRRFDSGACFAVLLGDANNGRWRIAPAGTGGAGAKTRVRRRYRRDTLILETEFTSADGAVVLIVLIGRRADARRLFQRLVGLCNDVGLLAEEYDTGARRMVGNFPQALSHIALINTAHNIVHALKPCYQRSGIARLAEAAE